MTTANRSSSGIIRNAAGEFTARPTLPERLRHWLWRRAMRARVRRQVAGLFMANAGRQP